MELHICLVEEVLHVLRFISVSHTVILYIHVFPSAIVILGYKLVFSTSGRVIILYHKLQITSHTRAGNEQMVYQLACCAS